MLLPRGITEITGRNEGPPSFSDYEAFRGHCYDASRTVGGFVRSFHAPRSETACNYALAVIDLRHVVVAVSLNGVFPLPAFAAPPAEGRLQLDFTDCPALAIEFERFGGYAFPSADVLGQSLTRAMCRELASHEQRRVKYFRPTRVGDVIFNYWD